MPESIDAAANTVLDLLPAVGQEIEYRDFHAQALAATPNGRAAISALKNQGRIKTRLIVNEDGSVTHFVGRAE